MKVKMGHLILRIIPAMSLEKRLYMGDSSAQGRRWELKPNNFWESYKVLWK